MAAFARPSGPAVPSPPQLNADRAASNHQRSLPRGQCNYRDLSRGTQALSCGCRSFWHDNSRINPQRRGVVGEASYTCVCSHHACFHDAFERAQQDRAGTETGSPESRAPGQAGLTDKSPVFLQLASSNGGETRFQLMAGTHPVSLRGLEHGKRLGVVITTPKNGGQNAPDRPSSVVARFEQQAAQGSHRIIEQLSSQSSSPARPSRARSTAYGLHHNSQQQSQQQDGHAQQVRTQREAYGNGSGGIQASQQMRPPSIPAGLGLSLQGRAMANAAFDQSPTPTVPDDPAEMANLLSMFGNESLPSTVNPSVDGMLRGNSPNRDFIQQVLTQRNNLELPLEIPLELPNQASLDNFLRNVTEGVAPSTNPTPDLTEVQRYVQETTDLVEAISQEGLAVQPHPDHDEMEGNSAGAQHEANDAHSTALQKLPATLQRLVPSLSGLLDHLKRYPSFSTSLQALSQRVDALQNVSFDHITPDEFQNKFDFFEGRVLELEGRVKEHDDLHAGVEADHSSHGGVRGRQYHPSQAAAGASFSSNISGASATSSALIQAAIDRQQTESKLNDLQERLEILETTALPSLSNPWELEVVLLPWGRQLVGLWKSSASSEEAFSEPAMQASGEWNQAHSLKSSGIRSASHSFTSGQDGGWTNQAIYDWADASDAWFVPRACSPAGIIYKRLRSRGFVRKVSLTNCGARQVQATIASAFRGVLDELTSLEEDDEHPMDAEKAPGKSFLGLNSPLIPLRKVYKSPRLRFLGPSELVTPALWDAQFLASNVLMRAPGGQKRLFVTTKDAYLQRSHEHSEPSWQSLRELPRFVGTGADTADRPSHVGEGDAKEACWEWHAKLDPAQSAHSSFGSSFSRHSQRQASVHSTQRSDKPNPPNTSILQGQGDVNEGPLISPLSEFPPPRGHQRTTSTPLQDPLSASAPASGSGHSLARHREAAKRRVASFEQAVSRTSNPAPQRRHTLEPLNFDPSGPSTRTLTHRVSESPPKTRQPKRRRISRSSNFNDASSATRVPVNFGTNSNEAPLSGETTFDRQVRLFPERQPSLSVELDDDLYNETSQSASALHIAAPTPRRSREPPSPFVTVLDASRSLGNDSRAGPSSAGGVSAIDPIFAAWRKGDGVPYATPYSASGPIGGFGWVGGDTQADGVSLAERDATGAAEEHGMEVEEDVWEGVEGSDHGVGDEHNARQEEEDEDAEDSEYYDDDNDDEDDDLDEEEF